MEYNQDGDYYRLQRAEGDILKTWITNPDNSGWILDLFCWGRVVGNHAVAAKLYSQ
jgi:hypothetical protein